MATAERAQFAGEVRPAPIVVRFNVPCVPVAQPRPKATIRAGHAAVYGAASSHPIHAFKASVRMAAQQAHHGAPLSGPVSLLALFVFPRPTARVWKSKPMPREPKTTKPDVDNLVKGLQDALNQLLFADDAQITDCRVQKCIAAGDEQPHVEIEVSEI